jgi:hypothetical protein
MKNAMLAAVVAVAATTATTATLATAYNLSTHSGGPFDSPYQTPTPGPGCVHVDVPSGAWVCTVHPG